MAEQAVQAFGDYLGVHRILGAGAQPRGGNQVLAYRGGDDGDLTGATQEAARAGATVAVSDRSGSRGHQALRLGKPPQFHVGFGDQTLIFKVNCCIPALSTSAAVRYPNRCCTGILTNEKPVIWRTPFNNVYLDGGRALPRTPAPSSAGASPPSRRSCNWTPCVELHWCNVAQWNSACSLKRAPKTNRHSLALVVTVGGER